MLFGNSKESVMHTHTHTHTLTSLFIAGPFDTAVHTLVLNECLASVKAPLLMIHSADQSTALHDVDHALDAQHLHSS